MKSTNDAIRAGFREEFVDGVPYWRFDFGPAWGPRYSLALEPLHGGMFYVAVYQDGDDDALTEKVPVRAIAKPDALDPRRPENQMPGPR